MGMQRRRERADGSTVSARHAAAVHRGGLLPPNGLASRAEVVSFMKTVPSYPREEIEAIERFVVVRWHDELAMNQFLTSLSASIRAEDFLGLEYKIAALVANDISQHADLIYNSNAFAAITQTQRFWKMSSGQPPAAERCTRLALLLAIKLNNLKSV